MSRYPGDKEINSSVESFLMIGDPVPVNNSKDGPIIANIAKITKSNQVLKQIDLSSNNQIKDVELTLRRIDTEVIDGKHFWKGTTSSDTFKCIGGQLPSYQAINRIESSRRYDQVCLQHKSDA